MHSAGLSYDTTFDLRQTLDLQYTTESHWRLKTPDLFFILSEHALLASEDWSLSCVLDAWGASGAKVLSITWEPDRPWTPPQAVRLANGPWREVLIRLHRSQGWLSSLHRELPLSRCG